MQSLLGLRMRSAANVNPQEGDAPMLKHLLDWPKDLVVPEADLRLKKMSMAFCPQNTKAVRGA